MPFSGTEVIARFDDTSIFKLKLLCIAMRAGTGPVMKLSD